MILNMNFYQIKKTLLIGALCMSTNILTACNSFDLLGIPRVDIENHLGVSMIGTILKEANVTTGASIYDGSRAVSYIKKENTKLYQVILSEIESAHQGDMPIEATLNASNLGVFCKDSICQYHGYYIKNFSNFPKDKMPTGKHTSRGDVSVTFNPDNLAQTYHISITEKSL